MTANRRHGCSGERYHAKFALGRIILDFLAVRKLQESAACQILLVVEHESAPNVPHRNQEDTGS